MKRKPPNKNSSPVATAVGSLHAPYDHRGPATRPDSPIALRRARIGNVPARTTTPTTERGDIAALLDKLEDLVTPDDNVPKLVKVQRATVALLIAQGTHTWLHADVISLCGKMALSLRLEANGYPYAKQGALFATSVRRSLRRQSAILDHALERKRIDQSW